MAPDFNKATVETLAKRAAYKCSNPECRISTVGPNSDPKQATVIGEAAHIFGARPASKRFRQDMTDSARGEITNAIWLCRNCHKLIDSDAKEYSCDELFAWREQHERFVLTELGTASQRIQLEHQDQQLVPFLGYPPVIRRIVVDKPRGWEYRLTAALLRHLNGPHLRRLDDLRDGLRASSHQRLDNEDVAAWVQDLVTNFSALIQPISNLLARLNKSWGEPGEPGDVSEIHHICRLISDCLEQMVWCEEKVYFTSLPDKGAALHALLKDVIGSQATRLAEIPEILDGAVSLIDSDEINGTRHVIEKTIVFELPKDWAKKVNRELRRVTGTSSEFGCGSQILLLILIVIIIFSFL